MWPNPQKTADLVIFTEEILKEKLHFLCSDIQSMGMNIMTRWNAKFLVVRCSETGHESYYTDLIKFNILSLAIILQQGGLHYVLRKQYCTAQKIKFSIKYFFGKCDQILQSSAFTKEFLNGKLHFLCSVGVKILKKCWVI